MSSLEYHECGHTLHAFERQGQTSAHNIDLILINRMYSTGTMTIAAFLAPEAVVRYDSVEVESREYLPEIVDSAYLQSLTSAVQSDLPTLTPYSPSWSLKPLQELIS